MPQILPILPILPQMARDRRVWLLRVRISVSQRAACICQRIRGQRNCKADAEDGLAWPRMGSNRLSPIAPSRCATVCCTPLYEHALIHGHVTSLCGARAVLFGVADTRGGGAAAVRGVRTACGLWVTGTATEPRKSVPLCLFGTASAFTFLSLGTTHTQATRDRLWLRLGGGFQMGG